MQCSCEGRKDEFKFNSNVCRSYLHKGISCDVHSRYLLFPAVLAWGGGERATGRLSKKLVAGSQMAWPNGRWMVS